MLRITALAAIAMLLLLNTRAQVEHTGNSLQPDSPAKPPTAAPQPNPREPLYAFYESLLSGRQIVPDTSWYANLDPEECSADAFSSIARPMWGDDPHPYVDFPFTDLKLRYHEAAPHDYFTLRGQRFTETVYSSDNRFFISSIRRFSYRGGKYLVFNGGLRDYNGYGGRINFNYFFDLSGKKIVADMYENAWGSIYFPFLYGDLNGDSLLDRVRFDGQLYPTAFSLPDSLAQTARDTITVTAETYENRKWRPLLDSHSKPYFIEVLVDANDSVALGGQHWLRPVALKR